MTTESITRVKLTASDGCILTNGKIYGKVIFLAEGLTGDDFKEITEEEYEKIKEEEITNG